MIVFNFFDTCMVCRFFMEDFMKMVNEKLTSFPSLKSGSVIPRLAVVVAAAVAAAVEFMLKTYKTLEIALEMWLWSPEVLFKDKTLQKICFSKEFCTFLHFLHCKFTLRKNLKDLSELVLTYGGPSKKCKDFMKNFPNNFDPIFGVAVVKLRFHVAVAVTVAVAVGQMTASRGMGSVGITPDAPTLCGRFGEQKKRVIWIVKKTLEKFSKSEK